MVHSGYVPPIDVYTKWYIQAKLPSLTEVSHPYHVFSAHNTRYLCRCGRIARPPVLHSCHMRTLRRPRDRPHDGQGPTPPRPTVDAGNANSGAADTTAAHPRLRATLRRRQQEHFVEQETGLCEYLRICIHARVRGE